MASDEPNEVAEWRRVGTQEGEANPEIVGEASDTGSTYFTHEGTRWSGMALGFPLFVTPAVEPFQ